MKHFNASIVIFGAALFTAACGGGGDTGTGAGGAGVGGASSSSGSGGAGGGLPACGASGNGVCVSMFGGDGCPTGFFLSQGECDAGGGSVGSCCFPSESSFPCGTTGCDTATQYCLKESGGPCCGPSSYVCVDLPQACLSPGSDCTCFDQGGWPCMSGGGTQAACDTDQGGLTISCAYP